MSSRAILALTQVLGSLGDAAIDPLIDALKPGPNNPDKEARAAAAHSLGWGVRHLSWNVRAVDALIEALRDGEVLVRWSAKNALQGIDRPEVERALAEAGRWEDEARREKKAGWMVVLRDQGPERLNVIVALREVALLGLQEARERLESLPVNVVEGVSRTSAQATASKLRKAGAIVDI